MSTPFAAYRALSFDLYGTLIDWEAGLLSALAPWRQRTGLTLTDDALLEAYGPIESAVEAEHPTLLYPAVLGTVLGRLGEQLGHAATADERAAFGASVPDWPAFPDSVDALARLGRRFKLIVLSNVDRGSFAASNDRLGDPFDLVLTAQDLGSYKPDPRNFAALTARVTEVGVSAGELLHVAQSLYHDHAPARAAGLPSVWIDRRQGRDGSGATPRPSSPVDPRWSYPTMAAFAADALT